MALSNFLFCFFFFHRSSSATTPAPIYNDGRDDSTDDNSYNTTYWEYSSTDTSTNTLSTLNTDSPCLITDNDVIYPCPTSAPTQIPTNPTIAPTDITINKPETTQSVVESILTPTSTPIEPPADEIITNDNTDESNDNEQNNGGSNNGNKDNVSNAELQQTIIIAAIIIGSLLLSICCICLFILYRLSKNGFKFDGNMIKKGFNNDDIPNNMSNNSSGTQISMHNTVHSMSGETLRNINDNISINGNRSSSNLKVGHSNIISVDVSDIDSSGHSPRVSGNTTPLPNGIESPRISRNNTNVEMVDVVNTEMVKIINQQNRGKRGQSDSEALYGFDNDAARAVLNGDGTIATGMSVVSTNSVNDINSVNSVDRLNSLSSNGNNNNSDRLSGVSVRVMAGSKVDNNDNDNGADDSSDGEEGIESSQMTQVVIARNETLGGKSETRGSSTNLKIKKTKK